MSINGVSNQLGMTSLETHDDDLRAAERDHRGSAVSQNSTAAYGAPCERTAEAAPPFDLFQALGALFSGDQQHGNGPDAANKFDLGAILSSIFDFAGTQAKQNAAPTKHEDHVGVQKKVELSGETGDEHFKAKGRLAAEAHATAKSSSETFVDGKGVGVRAGAEASLGVSAEAEGSIKTDIGSISGRAKVSAELYARAQGEARAGPDGLSAAGKLEVGAIAKGEAETNLELADGLIKGHADANAEAGAGAGATGNAGISFNPPKAVVEAKAESFAGARAGYSARGGVAGVSYGIEAEVWAGAGAKIEVNGGLTDDGKFKIEFSIGVAVGVGAMVKVGIEIDTKDLGKAITGVVKAAGDIIGAIFGAVAGMFDGGSGEGAHAGKAIASAIKEAAPMIGQAAASAAKQEVDAANTQEEPTHSETKDGDTTTTERHERSKLNSTDSFSSNTSRTTKGTLVERSLS